MPTIPVDFVYLTGLRPELFRDARLNGSWDSQGRYSEQWSTVPMQPGTAEDGCPCFRATVELDDSQIGREFRWGVMLNGPGGPNLWGIPTEVSDRASRERYRRFILHAPPQEERYYLTHCRRLGANKYYPDGAQEPALRFSVWAPNARAVEVVLGNAESGYIADDRTGATSAPGEFPMVRDADGVWHTDHTRSPRLASFATLDHTPYMFAVTKDDGQVAYRTDLYSRCQIGRGGFNPRGQHFNGSRAELDGTKGCSVVIDPERVTRRFQELDADGRPVWPETQWLTEEEFWRGEFDPLRPVPGRIEDLVIYELHVGALGFNRPGQPGNLQDAIDLLDYLVDLGVNAIELMPLAEYAGLADWGYGTSHYMAIEYAGGGRDQMKYFIRECHRRGIAVLLDVVYNHFVADAERDEWAYDSNAPERNIYYWYDGAASDYPNPDGGYVDNGSTGYTARFWDEMVRKMFISSAAMLLSEFHIDGFRVDLTTAIHRDAWRHADGQHVGDANIFGAKFLREWSRTLRLVKPHVMLIAEDHSGWSAVTRTPDAGGLGFDAAWYAEYYHQLIGDATNDPTRARLLDFAGYGDDRPLAISYFAGSLAAAAQDKVIYHESHDEAGNSSYNEGGREIHSARTIMVAVNRAPLIGDTRRFAEARCHFACGITLLAAATPMFFMGEEVGAAQDYRFSDFIDHREDLRGERAGDGQRMFRFYQDIIRLRQRHDALRSSNIEVLHVHDANRVLAFRRWAGSEEFLVLASLNNAPFALGYTVNHPNIGGGDWVEVFNSDNLVYGGSGHDNNGTLHSWPGGFNAVLPANGFAVFERSAP